MGGQCWSWARPWDDAHLLAQLKNHRLAAEGQGWHRASWVHRWRGPELPNVNRHAMQAMVSCKVNKASSWMQNWLSTATNKCSSVVVPPQISFGSCISCHVNVHVVLIRRSFDGHCYIPSQSFLCPHLVEFFCGSVCWSLSPLTHHTQHEAVEHGQATTVVASEHHFHL